MKLPPEWLLGSLGGWFLGILGYELARDWIGIGNLAQDWSHRAPWWILGASIAAFVQFLKRRGAAHA